MKSIITSCVVLMSLISFGQSYNLDPTFGTNGSLVDTSISNAPINIYFENNNYFLINYSNSIACRNYDGSKNVAFGTNGIISFNGANETFLVKGSKLTNGNIYIFGQITNSNSSISKDLFIVKISTSGVLDSGFGMNGILKQDFGEDESLNDIQFLNDGKIMGIGTKSNSSTGASSLITLKITGNATLDTTFDINGYKKYTVDANEVSSGANLFGYENNILLVGKSYIAPTSGVFNHDLRLIKIDENGNLITSFGSNGFKHSALTDAATLGSFFGVTDVQIVNNQLYFQSPWAYSFNTQGKNLKKYSIDTNIMINLGWLPGGQSSFAIDGNQKIYFTGVKRCSPPTASHCQRDFELYRRNPDGNFDTSFHIDGSYSYNFFPSDLISDDMSSAFYLHNDGKILMVGYGYNPYSNGTGLEMLRLTDLPLSVDDNELITPIIINPVGDELMIGNLNSRTVTEIKIFDLLGKQVFYSQDNISKYNVSFLRKGIYIAKINIADIAYSIKIIKK